MDATLPRGAALCGTFRTLLAIVIFARCRSTAQGCSADAFQEPGAARRMVARTYTKYQVSKRMTHIDAVSADLRGTFSEVERLHSTVNVNAGATFLDLEMYC